MSYDGTDGKVEAPPRPAGNRTAAAAGASRPSTYGDRRLRLNPNTEHRPDKYDDVQADYDPCIFSALERHLPPEAPRDDKIEFMKDILSKYLPSGERFREIFDYSNIPGQAVLHHGRHWHGAHATTSGYMINLLMWCRSSVFREIKTYRSDFSSWCGECQFEMERLRLSIAATKLEFLRREGDSKAKV